MVDFPVETILTPSVRRTAISANCTILSPTFIGGGGGEEWEREKETPTREREPKRFMLRNARKLPVCTCRAICG